MPKKTTPATGEKRKRDDLGGENVIDADEDEDEDELGEQLPAAKSKSKRGGATVKGQSSHEQGEQRLTSDGKPLNQKWCKTCPGGWQSSNNFEENHGTKEKCEAHQAAKPEKPEKTKTAAQVKVEVQLQLELNNLAGLQSKYPMPCHPLGGHHKIISKSAMVAFCEKCYFQFGDAPLTSEQQDLMALGEECKTDYPDEAEACLLARREKEAEEQGQQVPEPPGESTDE